MGLNRILRILLATSTLGGCAATGLTVEGSVSHFPSAPAYTANASLSD